MRNWRQSVISQYQSSPRLMSLLAAIDAWLSPDASIENFYQTVWNIDTASGYGLDVWGRIVNIPRTVTLANFGYFGFGEAGDRVGFGLGPFGDFARSQTLNFVLTDFAYRQLILAKAAYNITDGSVPAINAILVNILFPGRGNAWVSDGGNAMPRFFGFFEAGDRLPFGHGPFADLVQLLHPVTFGFGEAGDRNPFGQAPFGDLFPTHSAIFVDQQPNMTLTYNFDFQLQQFEAAIVQSGVLPKPTGVLAKWNFIRGIA